ncbi:heme exporter protein CcmD [Pseudoxanthobacter sp.]|uniref:heme exporter protein CcmD n=1 Tax=Pseudoxanthobacter sp. TaxID=1925742 RepID=UPI002FE285D0
MSPLADLFTLTARHAGFVVAAYALTALTVGGLVVHLVAGHRRLRARLAALEARAGRGKPAS